MANFARLKNIKKSIVDFFSFKPASQVNEETVEEVKAELDNAVTVENVDSAVAQDVQVQEDVALEQPVENVEEVVNEEATVEEGDPVLKELDSLKVTSVYPMKEVKKAIKERDRAYFEELYTTEKAIKHTDIRGNQAATAVAGVSGAAYLGIVAASAVALPAVVMALIGFGVGGGVVYGINKLTGKESAFGALYRKLKISFGKIRPRIKVKNYKKEHDAAVKTVNAVINEDTNKYTTNLAKQKEVEQRFNDHIRALSSDEESTYKFDDDAESQSILDEITTDYKDALEMNYDLITNKENLEKEVEKSQAFVDEINNAKADVEAKFSESNDSLITMVNSLVEETKKLPAAIERYVEVRKAYEAANDDIDAEQAKEIALLEEAIEDLERLPNKDEVEYANALARAKKERAEITTKYDALRENSANDYKAAREQIEKDAPLFGDLCKLAGYDNEEVDSISVNGSRIEIESLFEANLGNSFASSISKYTQDYEDGAVIPTEELLDIGSTVLIVDKALKNEDTEDLKARLIASQVERNEEIKERLFASFDMNIEDAEQTIQALQGKIAEVNQQIENLEAITKQGVEESKAKLQARRATLTRESAQTALDRARNLRAEFERFKAEQDAKLEQEKAEQEIKFRQKHNLPITVER